MPKEDPTFEEFVDFVLESFWGGSRHSITRETLFERDLGVTGDDGDVLLADVEKAFGVQMPSDAEVFRRAFGLQDGELFFHSEGVGCIGLGCIAGLFGFRRKSSVVDLSVGKLHQVVLQLKKPSSHES